MARSAVHRPIHRAALSAGRQSAISNVTGLVMGGLRRRVECLHRTRLPVRRQSTKIRCPAREPRCGLILPRSRCPPGTLAHLSDLIRAHRRTVRSRWRRLDPGQQALLVLAHPLCPRSGRTARRHRPDPDPVHASPRPAGLRDSGWHPDPDRPDIRCRGPPLLLRETQAPRRQRPGPGRSTRPADPGLAGAARLGPRPQSRPNPPHRDRADQGSGGHLRRQGLPRCPRRHRCAVLRPATCPSACAR